MTVTADPRTPNARDLAQDAQGKVIGVYVDVLERPDSEYACTQVALLDEYQAQGNTIATVYVRDRAGRMLSEPVFLAWPWNGGESFGDGGLPGTPGPPAVHMIKNAYTPPNRGPLAIYVGGKGDIRSDIVGGLGLPLGHHVSYLITFERRGPADEGGHDNLPPDDGTGGGEGTPPPTNDVTELAAEVAALAAEVELLRPALVRAEKAAKDVTVEVMRLKALLARWTQ
jgi:hypothetical protein